MQSKGWSNPCNIGHNCKIILHQKQLEKGKKWTCIYSNQPFCRSTNSLGLCMLSKIFSQWIKLLGLVLSPLSFISDLQTKDKWIKHAVLSHGAKSFLRSERSQNFRERSNLPKVYLRTALKKIIECKGSCRMVRWHVWCAMQEWKSDIKVWQRVHLWSIGRDQQFFITVSTGQNRKDHRQFHKNLQKQA